MHEVWYLTDVESGCLMFDSGFLSSSSARASKGLSAFRSVEACIRSNRTHPLGAKYSLPFPHSIAALINKSKHIQFVTCIPDCDVNGKVSYDTVDSLKGLWPPVILQQRWHNLPFLNSLAVSTDLSTSYIQSGCDLLGNFLFKST
jgi:hypothetical protein